MLPAGRSQRVHCDGAVHRGRSGAPVGGVSFLVARHITTPLKHSSATCDMLLLCQVSKVSSGSAVAEVLVGLHRRGAPCRRRMLRAWRMMCCRCCRSATGRAFFMRCAPKLQHNWQHAATRAGGQDSSGAPALRALVGLLGGPVVLRILHLRLVSMTALCSHQSLYCL